MTTLLNHPAPHLQSPVSTARFLHHIINMANRKRLVSSLVRQRKSRCSQPVLCQKKCQSERVGMEKFMTSNFPSSSSTFSFLTSHNRGPLVLRNYLCLFFPIAKLSLGPRLPKERNPRCRCPRRQGNELFESLYLIAGFLLLFSFSPTLQTRHGSRTK